MSEHISYTDSDHCSKMTGPSWTGHFSPLHCSTTCQQIPFQRSASARHSLAQGRSQVFATRDRQYRKSEDGSPVRREKVFPGPRDVWGPTVAEKQKKHQSALFWKAKFIIFLRRQAPRESFPSGPLWLSTSNEDGSYSGVQRQRGGGTGACTHVP